VWQLLLVHTDWLMLVAVRVLLSVVVLHLLDLLLVESLRWQVA
jgi:hypothetical protein